MTPNNLPDVFAYTDYRDFLGAWFTAKKEANPNYSHRLFARRAGQRSPSLLKHIIDGDRQLTLAALPGFLDALGLDAAESDFFRHLVELARARNDEERNEAWAALSAQRRFREARRVDGDGFAYLSSWYIPAVRELAARQDFRADPYWIASRIQPRITVKQAREALSVLETLGMLVEDGDRWVPADGSVVTAPQVTGLAVHNYHRGMIARQSDAISGAEPSERHLLGVTVLVPEALVSTLKESLDAFQARVLDLCDSAQDGTGRVMQVNLALFPLSTPSEDP